MTDKEQSFANLIVELQRLANSGVIDMLSAAVARLNACGKDVEDRLDAIHELLRPIYYTRHTHELAKRIGQDPDYLPRNFIQISGDLAQLKEQLQRILTAYKDVFPTEPEETFEDVIIENYTQSNVED